jgi:membrane-bound lytic murein transglycosylase D
MVARNLLKLALLALPLLSPAQAETNIAGEEIVLLNDSESGNVANELSNLDSLQISAPNDIASFGGYSGESENVASGTDGKTDLWSRIKSGYAMPELKSQATTTHESWYASRPDYMKRMVDRSQKYLYHIVEEVQKRGMPTEIALLPMVESAFNPKAYSTSKASGIWQFIPSTGKNFGLKQTWWVDNRRDVTAATDAALTYLQKLHVMFGTWDLALAAYNAGEGTVMRAIERNRKNGLPTDYQSLNLPAETKNYVPKLQAVKNIISNPGQYGLDLQPIANQPYFTKVTAPKQIDVNLAAKLAGVSLDEFTSLNPEHNRPVMSNTEDSHEILLPMGADLTFTANLASYDKPLVSWQTYNAKRGERLNDIARKFGVSTAHLRDVNDINSKDKLSTARPMMVPTQGKPTEVALAMAEPAPLIEDAASNGAFTSKRHVVKKGETLKTIAKSYDISTKQLLAYNHLKSTKLRNGQVLLVQAGESTQVTKTERVKTRIGMSKSDKIHYVVRRGDTLTEIARKFDVATNDLQRWNNLRSTRITPGHRLKILKSDAA